MGGTTKRAVTVLLSVVAIALASACADVDPQTGSIRPACKDADSNPAVTVDFAVPRRLTFQRGERRRYWHGQ